MVRTLVSLLFAASCLFGISGPIHAEQQQALAPAAQSLQPKVPPAFLEFQKDLDNRVYSMEQVREVCEKIPEYEQHYRQYRSIKGLFRNDKCVSAANSKFHIKVSTCDELMNALSPYLLYARTRYPEYCKRGS